MLSLRGLQKKIYYLVKLVEQLKVLIPNGQLTGRPWAMLDSISKFNKTALSSKDSRKFSEALIYLIQQGVTKPLQHVFLSVLVFLFLKAQIQFIFSLRISVGKCFLQNVSIG